LRADIFCVWQTNTTVLLQKLFCRLTEEGGNMTENILAYRSSMAVALGLLKKGLISEEEYRHIDVMIANNHDVNLSTLCCRNPLLLSDFRANMSQSAEKGDDMNASDN